VAPLVLSRNGRRQTPSRSAPKQECSFVAAFADASEFSRRNEQEAGCGGGGAVKEESLRLLGGAGRAARFVLRSVTMRNVVLVAAAAMTLAGCGTQMGDRLATGAAIGAGAGAVAGGVGALPGAVIGAAVGGLTSPDQVNLGEPVWEDDDD